MADRSEMFFWIGLLFGILGTIILVMVNDIATYDISLTKVQIGALIEAQNNCTNSEYSVIKMDAMSESIWLQIYCEDGRIIKQKIKDGFK